MLLLSFIFLVYSVILKSVQSTSLYTFTDPVIELDSDNITSIYNSSDIWIVEFYAHWCGHCIRYKDTWINVGASFKNWNGTVKIAAYNCAEEECDNFEIPGTPTIRAFSPYSQHSTIGENIASINVLNNIIDFIENITKKGLAPLHIPNLTPFVGLHLLMEWSQTSEFVNQLIFLVENSDHYWGRHLIVYFGISHQMHFRRIFMSDEIKNSKNLNFLNSFPAIIIFHKNSQESQVFYIDSNGEFSDFEQAKIILKSIHSDIVPEESSLTISPTTPIYYDYTNKNDTVYIEDLELGLQYALFTEIPLQHIFNENKLKVLYNFLEVCNLYLPLHNGIRNVLRSLNEWILGFNIVFMTNDIFKAKVKILSHEYSAFNYTAKTWKRCLGSSQLYRGYPCSLWTLFHTLTANEMIDTGGTGTLVAPRIIDYITHFFSCRHCAENFLFKVKNLRENNNDDDESMMRNNTGVLWLWNIHNGANRGLMGDKTEDPQYPKIIWPSSENCHQCRNKDRSWNLTAVSSYLLIVYDKMNIRVSPNQFNDEYLTRKLSELKDNNNFLQIVNDYCQSKIYL